MPTELQVQFEKGKTLSCAVSSPSGTSGAIGIILAHGAGGDMDSGNLPQFAEAFAGAGFPCLRFTCKPTQLAYRVRACQAIIDGMAEVDHLKHVTHWIFAGHSMGARVASAMAAANPDRALACIFFSYPLHTPGNKDNFRDCPLVDLKLPVLFVHGSKDSMCAADTFQAVKDRMSCFNLQVHEVDGADHGLKVHAGKDSQAKTQAALQQVTAAMCTFANAIKDSKIIKPPEDNLDNSSQQPQSHKEPMTAKPANKRFTCEPSQSRSKKSRPS